MSRRLALRGADCVLLALSERFAGVRTGHNASLIIHAQGALDPARVREALCRFLDYSPWPAAHLFRPLPWGPLSWKVLPPAVRVPPPVEVCASAPADVVRKVEDELNQPINARHQPPLRVRLLDLGAPGGAPQSVLIMTWSHVMMDPRGAEFLLAALARLDTDGSSSWGSELPEFEPAADPRPVQERGRIALRGIAHLRELGRTPPLSLGRGARGSGRARFLRKSYREPAATSDRRCREITWRLAIVGRAVAELWQRRGLPDVPFLVPLSVDQRKKGASGPFFGNCLAFHFARFRPSEAGDPEAVAKQLRQQMIDALREGQIESNLCGMDFLKYRPVRWMLREMPWVASGETFSFNCADTVDFSPGLETAFGARIANAFHVPTVLPRPGLGVFFSHFAPRNNIVICWAEGVVTEAEAERILDSVAAGLAWVPES
jgi:hypothetical protein